MIRVCVCTSNEGSAEPRAPRHAAAIAAAKPNLEIVFVDCAPEGTRSSPPAELIGYPNVRVQTHTFPSRASGVVRLVLQRLWQKIVRMVFRLTRVPAGGSLSTRALGMRKDLSSVAADVYIAHNIDTLEPAAMAAQERGALLMFDSMEFHSDMGEGQTRIEKEIVHAIQRRYLPKCSLILTSSDLLADALMEEYEIKRPLPLFNVPPCVDQLSSKMESNLALYWRNAVVGLSQRGLDDALVAMTALPADVELHIQGKLPNDGGVAMRKRVAELGLQARIHIRPPYSPGDAVKEASRYHIGLCLERPGVRNHELTVSNKMFDYHMAGLAIVSSDLLPLRSVLERSHGGLLFTPGIPEDLSRKILTLYNDRAALSQFASNARRFALQAANRELEMRKFIDAFVASLSKRSATL